MTVKSHYKLDDRIESMDDVQTCLRYDDSYIGERGYFASDLCDLSDLSSCVHGTLAQIILDGAGDDIFRTPHDVEYGNWGSRFFVPERLLKPIEKKFRPFSLNEFLNRYHLGDEIIVRRKLNKDRRIHKLFTEYGGNDDTVHLGTYWFTFKDLYDNYEIYTDKGWQPFGVLDEEKE